MTDSAGTELTSSQFHAMGYFINKYAKIEGGISVYFAWLMQIPLHEAKIILAPYTARDYRAVLKGIEKLRDSHPEHREKWAQLLGDLGGFSKLRNAIAHDYWTRGSREGAIKPIGISTRGNHPEFYGIGEKERDYTDDELQGECEKLDALHGRFLEFYEAVGASDYIARLIRESSG